jgi:hypothetical protein
MDYHRDNFSRWGNLEGANSMNEINKASKTRHFLDYHAVYKRSAPVATAYLVRNSAE